MRKYSKVLDDLEMCVNGKLNQKNADVFLNLINEFKQDFKKGISTKFLRDLIKNKSNRNKTYRISYFIKKSNLKTEKSIRFNFHEWVLNKFAVDVVEYTYDKRFKMRDEEKAYIKDIRKQDVGKLGFANKNEILHFIN